MNAQISPPLAASMPLHAWVYRCRVTSVIDGDTLQVELDLGLHTYRVGRVRLLGVDTPERKGLTRAAGDAARVYTAAWLAEAGSDPWPLTIQTAKDPDSFGRFLGTIWRNRDGRCLNADLLADGMAVPFDG